MRRIPVAAVCVLVLASGAWGAAPPRPWKSESEKVEWIKEARGASLALAEEGRFAEAAKKIGDTLAVSDPLLGRDHEFNFQLRDYAERWGRLARLPGNQRREVVRAEAAAREAQRLFSASRFAESLALFKKSLKICRDALGEDHPETATGYNRVAQCLDRKGLHAEALPYYKDELRTFRKSLGTFHVVTAISYANVAYCLDKLGRFIDALPLLKMTLAIRRELLTDSHFETADSYHNMGICLREMGENPRALPLLRKGLEIRLRTQGAQHNETAESYAGMATCLDSLGRHAEALALHEKALAIREKNLGETHPETARSYNNLATCLNQQGNHARALPLFRKALLINQAVFREQHPTTAMSYNNLASCLHDQGKAAEALPLYETALKIREAVLKENPLVVAISHNNVASCLIDLGKPADAAPLLRKAVAAWEKGLGEENLRTAAGYANLANCQHLLGRHREALSLHEKAMRIRKKILPQDHPDVALSHENHARYLAALGKDAEALAAYREGLRLHLRARGEDHPDTARCCNRFALYLYQRGERLQAVRLWQQSMPGQEAARAQAAASGFDRAESAASRASPNALLAVALARLGQPRNAFRHAEAALARGLLEDLASPDAEGALQAGMLRARLAKLDQELVSYGSTEKLTDTQQVARTEVLKQQRDLSSRVARLASEHSARQVLSLESIQKHLAADAALVLWIDADEAGERWGCVVRRQGDPHWERVLGSGKAGAWTRADGRLASNLYETLIDPSSDGPDRRDWIAAFAKQRLDPLRLHLKAAAGMPAVKHLFVVPTGPLARVPAELLDDTLSISYVPSGSVLAKLAQKHRAVDGSSLLALGDPTFTKELPKNQPSSGVLLTTVLAGGNAAKAGLRAGDVLLSVGPAKIKSAADLGPALKHAPDGIEFWRDGKTREARLPGAPLSAVFDPRPVSDALEIWWKAALKRGTGHNRLPGTRVEVEAIASLVKGGKTLLGSDASEQKLDELRARGDLKAYRVILVATHGETDELSPGRSAVILAQDGLPDPIEQARARKHVYDGRLTVARIRELWELDADVVTLSACETGLGRDAQGEGMLGFAQAFIHKGARAVVLSRWKVDDAATSLLMIRFHENLLGKREGLKAPMGRAASLHEAKAWLRSLSRKEAGRLAALHANGIVRGTIDKRKIPPNGTPGKIPDGEKPYLHPFYWAAFTLIGDPD